MNRLVSPVLGPVVLFGLSAGLALAADAPRQGPASEDPQVADYIKKKGWLFYRDKRILDGKPLTFLSVEQRGKPFEGVTLSKDDLQTIARSKTIQVLDLRKVKNLSDEGIKAVAGIPQLEAIIISSEKVTDTGMKELAKAQSLETVALIFTKKVSDAGVKELATLPKLRWLMLTGMTLSGSAFEAFAGSKTLESVTLEYVDGLTDGGVKHLGALPKLNELKIGAGFGESKLTTAGIKAIVDVRLPAKFDFNRKLIDDDLLESLVKKGFLYGPTPPGLKDKKPATPEEVRSINLDDSKVTDRGMQAVLNCTNVANLYLERTGISDETLKKLSEFKKLEYLSLGKTKVTAAGLEALAALPIRHIALQECELSEDAFRALGKMTALEELWLSDAKMKAEWLMHIARLPKLKELNLLRADFDDAAARYTATMPNLQSLTLNDTRLGDAGFKQLLQLPKLRRLSVDGTKVSKAVYQKAKKEHPKLTLYYYGYDN